MQLKHSWSLTLKAHGSPTTVLTQESPAKTRTVSPYESTAPRSYPPRQFIDSYASSQVNLTENVIGKYADITPATADTPSVLAVKISLRRSPTNVDGQFSAIDWRIISLQSPSLSMQPDWDLWELADTHMIDQSAFSIQEGSEYATVVPFSIQSQGEYFDPSPLRTRLPLEQGDYEFVVTNSPVRKLITFATH